MFDEIHRVGETTAVVFPDNPDECWVSHPVDGPTTDLTAVLRHVMTAGYYTVGDQSFAVDDVTGDSYSHFVVTRGGQHPALMVGGF